MWVHSAPSASSSPPACRTARGRGSCTGENVPFVESSCHSASNATGSSRPRPTRTQGLRRMEPRGAGVRTERCESGRWEPGRSEPAGSGASEADAEVVVTLMRCALR